MLSLSFATSWSQPLLRPPRWVYLCRGASCGKCFGEAQAPMGRPVSGDRALQATPLPNESSVGAHVNEWARLRLGLDSTPM